MQDGEDQPTPKQLAQIRQALLHYRFVELDVWLKEMPSLQDIEHTGCKMYGEQMGIMMENFKKVLEMAKATLK